MLYQEAGRRYLSPGLLRIVDLNGIPYDEMQPGQLLKIYAIDAVTQEQGTFSVEVLEFRPPQRPNNLKSATLRFLGGDFNFCDGSDTSRAIRIEPGLLMENGASGNLYPQFDAHMVYLGGIKLGRDHSFEYVGSEDVSMIARGIEMIDVKAAPENFKAPDLTDHKAKIKALEEAREQAKKQNAQDLDTQIKGILLERFDDDTTRGKIESVLSGFSVNGKIALISYFMYAQEDGVLDAAWRAYQRAYERDFQFDHPDIRGNVDFKASTRAAFMNMTREAGIKWPRPRGNKQISF